MLFPSLIGGDELAVVPPLLRDYATATMHFSPKTPHRCTSHISGPPDDQSIDFSI
jgi:hypothetical protein